MASLVFITGASSGLGAALARALPFEARCIDISRRGAPGLEHVKADLSTPEGWAAASRAFGEALDGFRGERAVLIHASGTLEPIGYAGDVDPGSYRSAVLLNSAAGQILGDAFLHALRRAHTAATIAMISSGAAFLIYPGWSAYAAGKASLDQWVRTVAAEQALRGSSVRICSIAPGILDTEMQAQARAPATDAFPWVQEFRDLAARGQLRSPDLAAREIWDLLLGDAPSGSVIDLHHPPDTG